MADKQDWGRSLSLAGVGIVGALLGSTAQHFLTLNRDRSRAFEEGQREAYVAFLNALDKSRLARQEKAAGRDADARKLEIEFELHGGAALRRIAIYGDKRVLEALAEWSRQSTNLEPCANWWKADLAIWERMREISLGAGQSVSAGDLAELALFCRPPAGQ